MIDYIVDHTNWNETEFVIPKDFTHKGQSYLFHLRCRKTLDDFLLKSLERGKRILVIHWFAKKVFKSRREGAMGVILTGMRKLGEK